MKNTIVNDSFKIYRKFKYYSYKIVMKEKILELEFLDDRFPHLVGLNKVVNKKAREIVEILENDSKRFILKNIRNHPEFLNMKYKLLYFEMLEDIFVNFNLYKIYKIDGKIKTEFIILKFENNIEINLCLDFDKKLRKYIPKSFLANSKSKDYGKFIKDSKLEEVLRIERLNKITKTVDIIYSLSNIDLKQEVALTEEMIEPNEIKHD